MADHPDSIKNKILSLSFNQDQGCFAAGTEKGFRIYNTIPFKDTFRRDFQAGIGLVSMLFRTNILALVGGGIHPKYPLNKVMLWDDHQEKCIGELSFKGNIRSVKMRKDKIAVALEQRIYIYQFHDLKLLDAVDTCQNPLGLCAFSVRDTSILVCPDKKKGFIRIVNYDTNTNVEKKAHESSITAIALSQDGKLCATTSDKGTLIRVFATDTGKLIQELRRGADKAEIKSLSFDASGIWLACTSDKGTVHIFSTLESNKAVNKGFTMAPSAKEEKKAEVKNPTSAFKFMKGFISYFSSEWSFAQFRIPEHNSLVSFGAEDKNQIIVVTYDGKYYLAEFDPKTGGECKKILEKSLLSELPAQP